MVATIFRGPTVVAIFAQIDALPCAQVETAACYGNVERHTAYYAFGMARHIVTTLHCVKVVRVVLRHHVVHYNI